jgi:hypothetical protein
VTDELSNYPTTNIHSSTTCLTSTPQAKNQLLDNFQDPKQSNINGKSRRQICEYIPRVENWKDRLWISCLFPHQVSSYLRFENNTVSRDRIVITKTGPSGSTWADVCKEFQPDTACWVTYHFSYTTKEGGKRNKTTLIRWVPTTAKPKEKMEYATWSSVLKNALSGIQCTIQATEVDEIDYQVVLERVAKFERDEI